LALAPLFAGAEPLVTGARKLPGISAVSTITASLLKSRSNARMTTLVSECSVSWAFSRGSWASARRRILASIASCSPFVNRNGKERDSLESASETAAMVCSPGAGTGSLVEGRAPSAATGVFAEGGGFAGCCLAASGPRRRNTGRSGSSASLVGTELETGAGVPVASGEGDAEAGGDCPAVLLLSPRRRMGRSLSLLPVFAAATGAVDFSGAGGFATCHLPRPRHVGSLAALTMVT